MFKDVSIVRSGDAFTLRVPVNNLIGARGQEAHKKISVPTDIDMSSMSTWPSERPKDAYSFQSPSDTKSSIVQARYHFYRDPLVRRIIEFLSQLASSSIRLKGSKENTKKLFSEWMRQIHLKDRICKWLFLEYFLGANAFTMRQTAKISEGSLKEIKKGDFNLENYRYETASVNDDLKTVLEAVVNKSKQKQDVYTGLAQAAAKKMWSKKVIPCDYTVLKPENICIDGSPEFDLIRIFYTPDAELVSLINASLQGSLGRFNKIIKSLPLYFVSQIAAVNSLGINMKGAGYSSSLRVELFPEDVRHITRMKQPYEKWAVPLMNNAFEALDRKKKLTDMDRKLVDQVIQSILLIKVGSDTFPAKARHLDTVNKMLKQQGSVWKLVWNHAIDMKWIDVDIEGLVNKDKYEPVNNDIRSAFGITPLFTGESEKGSMATAMVSMRGLIENVTDAQQEVAAWIRHEFEYMAEVLQLDSVPDPEFNVFTLEDKAQLSKIRTGMVDRKILSNQTVAELEGENYEDEIERIKKENKLREDGTLPPSASPYHTAGGSNPPTAIDPNDSTQNMKGSDGKPSNSITEYPNNRKNKTPKGQNNFSSKNASSYVFRNQDEYYSLYEFQYLDKLMESDKEINRLYHAAMDAFGIFYERYDDEYNTIQPYLEPYNLRTAYDFSEKILSNIDMQFIESCDLSKMPVQYLLDINSVKLERCIKGTKDGLVKKWKKQNKNKKISEKINKKLTSAAWAICRNALNE